MPTILETYERLHPTSASLYKEAPEVFPSGVTHDTRYVTPFPIYVRSAARAHKWDVDGNDLIDYVCGHGALLLGHSRPEVVAAVSEQVTKGTHYGASHELEIKWGRLVQQLIPSAELVRFTNSGTEATDMAVRLARASTGKDKLLKFENHFHGWSATLTGATVAGTEYPSAAGIPHEALAQQIIVPPNDPALVEQTFEERGDIAAVILEPTGAHMGKIPIGPEFLRELRDLCTRFGVVLIFDEVITGFRASPGGVQALYNVIPDITTLAKILAGGLPGGAVVGRADLLRQIAFSEDADWNASTRVQHPGTFNGNPLSAAAGCACLGIVAQGEANAHADRMMLLLARGMNEVLARAGIQGCVYGGGTILHVILGVECEGPEDGITWRWQDPKHQWVPHVGPSRTIALKRAMLNEGVDLMGDSRLIVSAAHTEADVEATVSAFERAVWQMREEDLL